MRHARAADLPRIVEIYNATIPLRIATADTEPVTVASREDWFARHDPVRRPIFVEEADGQVVGWLSLSDFVGRPGYGATVQIGLYVDAAHRGRGIGSALLAHAVEAAPALGIRHVIGLVFTHNETSLRLLGRFGFESWGRLPGVVEMDDNPYSVAILGLTLTKTPTPGTTKP